MKTKGQLVQAATPERLAFVHFDGGLAERLNAAELHSANGARTTVQGFKSLTRLQFSDPASSWSYQRGQIHTAEAVIDPQSYYQASRLWFQGENHSDMSFLPC